MYLSSDAVLIVFRSWTLNLVDNYGPNVPPVTAQVMLGASVDNYF